MGGCGFRGMCGWIWVAIGGYGWLWVAMGGWFDLMAGKENDH